jgi:sugar phosphate isomerase/epimerase
MTEPKVAVTFYTLRDFCKTPAEIAQTMHKVKAIGYDYIQFSALGPAAPEELKKMLDGEGLQVIATHTGWERLQQDLPAVIAEHQLWGCPHVAIGGAPKEYHNAEGYARLAQEASEIGRRLAQAGLTFSYHNHSHELIKYGGRTGLDILYGQSDPAAFCAEIDTYWIQHGGGDPVYWIRKLAGREPLVHFKDMGVRPDKPIWVEIGEGNLNWPAIIQASREAGAQYCIVEQDTCPGDPFESIAISLRNLRKLGMS